MDESKLKDYISEEALRTLVAGFYRRVPLDDIIGPMYPEQDFAGAEQRLADFLCFRILGNPKYIEERGHPRLKMRHLPFSIGTAERDRWLELMGQSMAEQTWHPEAKAWMDAFFTQVADHMRNRMERGAPLG
jgi:hemoglobin